MTAKGSDGARVKYLDGFIEPVPTIFLRDAYYLRGVAEQAYDLGEAVRIAAERLRDEYIAARVARLFGLLRGSAVALKALRREVEADAIASSGSRRRRRR
jgi:hypothetical protein